MYKHNLRKEITFINNKLYDPAKIENIEDINEILKKCNILTTTIFKKELSALYSMYSRNTITPDRPDGKWKTDELYYNKSEITVENINKFIKDRNILNEEELFSKYQSILGLMKRLGIGKDQLIFSRN